MKRKIHPPIYKLIVAIVAAFIGVSSTFAQVACTSANYGGAYVLNANDYPYFSPGSGVTVNAVTAGGVTTLNNFQYQCSGVTYNCTNPAWWLNNAGQSITLTFSQPVSSFSVIVNGTNTCEEFYFAQVGGCPGNLQVSGLCTAGWTSINGGTGLLYNGGTTSNLIVVNNSVGATTYLLTHNGCGAGSRYALVDCFVTAPAGVPGTLTSTMAHTDETCGQCDGTATVTPQGGVAPYTYTWNTVPVQNTQTATGLCAGTYIVNFTDNTGCASGADTVTIGSITATPPVITPAGPFCASDAPTNLVSTNPGGTWSGPGITNPTAGTFDPNNAGAGTHQIIYNDTGVCASADTINIVVNTAADATINGVGPFCLGFPPQILTAASPGGTWTGPGITNGATGEFDPGTAGLGTHMITYAIGGSCGDTQTTNITIVPNDDATITQVGPFCPLDAPLNLQAATGGGTWSGPGITDANLGTFDPGIAPAGSNTITYMIGGPCGDTATINIQINASLNAAITQVGPFCESDPNLLLTAVDPGGTWWGPGITNANTGDFDPNTAGPGTHAVYYGIPGNCGDTGTINIQIIPDADATITQVGPYCILDAAVNLTAVDPNGTWSGNGITNQALGTFDPNTAGVGSHTITYTIAGACGDQNSITIVVNAMDDATINPAGPYCESDPQVMLTSVTPGGTWSGNGITNAAAGAFSPAAAGPGLHTITYVTGGTCSSTSTYDIQVNGLPNVDFTVDTASLCLVPAQAFTFTNTTDTTGGMVGTSIWDLGDGNTAAGNTVSHTYANAGIYNITLTVTSTAAAGGCTNTLTRTNFVQVFQNPTADFILDPPITTVFNPTFTFIDQSYTNISSWTWDFGGLGTSFNQNPTYTFPDDTGNYPITLTVVDANGCVGQIVDYAKVTGEFGIYVPNAFTPGIDGVNDGFYPNGFGISSVGYEFYIFNRWGELIFESYTPYEPWNGVYKNNLVQNGVYAWRLIFKDLDGKIHKRTGHVTVIY